MVVIPVVIGGDVVREGDYISLLDELLKMKFCLKRIRSRPLCSSTQWVITEPFRKTASDTPYEVDPGLGATSTPISLLLHTEYPFHIALTRLSLINDSRGPMSMRARYGADLRDKKRLFMFLPVDEKHATLMTKAIF